MMPSRVDSVHRGGSKRALASNAALGEQRLWSFSSWYLDQRICVMSQTIYLVGLKALYC